MVENTCNFCFSHKHHFSGLRGKKAFGDNPLHELEEAIGIFNGPTLRRDYSKQFRTEAECAEYVAVSFSFLLLIFTHFPLHMRQTHNRACTSGAARPTPLPRLTLASQLRIQRRTHIREAARALLVMEKMVLLVPKRRLSLPATHFISVSTLDFFLPPFSHILSLLRIAIYYHNLFVLFCLAEDSFSMK